MKNNFSKRAKFFMALSNKDIENLIIDGYEILRDTYSEIRRLNTLVGLDEADFSREGLRQRIQNILINESSESQENIDPLLNQNFSDLNIKKQKKGCGNRPSTSEDVSISNNSKHSENQDNNINEIENEQENIDETEILKQYYKINALRPVIKIEPGRLPFRHDQLQRMQQYKKEWLKNPVPGEKNYQAERWEIRQKMAERDVPCLKVIERKISTEKRNEFRI